jgi:hypothetical protein
MVKHHRTQNGGPKKRGRPKGHTTAVLKRARFVHIARSAGLPDEAVLGGISPHELPSPDLSARERRRLIRKKLNRWGAPFGRSLPVSRQRKTLGHVLRDSRDDWIAVTRTPDWTPAEEESPAQMNATVSQLEQQARAVRAAEDAGSFAVPRTGNAEDYCQPIESKVTALRSKAKKARLAERTPHAVKVSWQCPICGGPHSRADHPPD